MWVMVEAHVWHRRGVRSRWRGRTTRSPDLQVRSPLSVEDCVQMLKQKKSDHPGGRCGSAAAGSAVASPPKVAGAAYRRCGCRDAVTGRQVWRCPRLADPDHGRWYIAVQVTG